jgi:hypothetical protein
VTVALADMGIKRVRIAKLPPEIPSDVLRGTLVPYGKVLEVHDLSWSKAYRYAVSNGIRQATVVMTEHTTSHLTVAGYRVLLTNDGQQAICYGCGNAGHMFQDCSTRQGLNRGEHRAGQDHMRMC